MGIGDPKPPGAPAAPEEAEAATAAQEAASNKALQDLLVRLDLLSREAELEAQKATLMDDQLAKVKENLNLQDVQISKIEQYVSKVKEISQLSGDQLEGLDAMIGKLEELGASSAKIQKLKDILATGDMEAFKKALQDISGELRDVTKFTRKLDGAMSKLGKTFGLAGKFGETGLGKVAGILTDMTTGDRIAKMKAMGAAVFNLVNPLNFLGSALDLAIKNMFKLDKITSEFAKNTGVIGDYSENIREMKSELKFAGVNMADTGKALGTTMQNFSAFTGEVDAATTAVTKQAAMLERLGVSAGESTKHMDFMHRALGVGAEASAAMTSEVMMMGRAIGLSSKKISKDFGAAMGKLSMYGKKGIEVFRGLAATAKAAGMEMASLMAVAGKFDTFEGGADAAAKLNAVLGTQISTMQMLNMTEEDRVRLIGMELKTMNFGQMSKYHQMYAAEALGLKDVAEARKLAAMDPSEIDQYVHKMENQLTTEEQMMEMAEKTVSAMDKMKLVLEELSESLEPLVKGLLDFIKAIDVETIKYWARLIKNIGLAYVALNGIMYTIIGAQKLHVMWTKREVAWTGIKTLKEKWATAGLRKLAVAQMMAMGPMAKFVMLLASLAAAWALTGSPPLWMMFSVVAGFVIAFGIALKFIQGPGQITIGLLALLAGAMGLMFYTVNLLVQALTGLFETLFEGATEFPMVAAGLFLIAGGLIAVGAAGVVATIGMFASLLGLAAIFATIRLFGFDTSELKEAGKSVVAVGAGMLQMGDALMKIEKSAKAIGTIKSDAFLAVSQEGGATKMVLASSGVISSVDTKNINVKVDIPEVASPKVNVKVVVEIDGKALDHRIKEIIEGDQ